MFIKPIDKKFLFLSVIKVLAVLVLISLAIEITSADQAFADLLYQWEGNEWQFKDGWVTATLIHKGGKYFSIALLLIVFAMLLISYTSSILASWKHSLQYLFVATVLGSLAVSIGKSITNISCPWDFSRYGGTLEYLSLIEQLWVRNGSQCFPAGHASAGFAWVALYFVGRYHKATWRWWGLGFALLLGSVFGISQQLRGAHFFSHDLWSFGICWMVSLICYEVMLKPYESTK
ncbi:MAG: hypothetical protein B0W54_19480 [Cellvibrio sp. 79]|nr:MAG: hypothetical protein B0W54_19480 [Cellvibrio sp. 79]